MKKILLNLIILILITPSVSFAISTECSSLNGILTLNGLAGSSEAERQMADCIAKENTSQYPNYIVNYDAALERATRYAANTIYNAQQEGITEVKEKYIAKKDKECKEIYIGINSHYEYKDENNYNKGDCSCNAGYALYEIDGVCEIKKKDVVAIKPSPLHSIACQKNYSDPNSHAEGDFCVCNTGYTLYSNKGVCEIKKPEVIAPVVIPEKQIVTTELSNLTPIVEPIKKEVKKPLPPKKTINKTATVAKEVIVPEKEVKEILIPVKIETKKVSFFERFFNWITGKN